LSEKVAGAIEEAIVSGTYPVGSRLPSEQALADQFAVSRNVVREAFKMLMERGLLDILSGSGAYVSRPNSEATSNALGRYLRLMGSQMPVGSLYEVRRVLEGSNVRLASQRADQQGLETMETCLARMERHEGSIERWVEADLDFHLAIAAATHNPLFRMLLEPLVDQLRGVIAEGYLTEGATTTGREAHQGIYRYISERRPDDAYRAMMEHLHDSEARVESFLAKRSSRSG
jgi:GntR family transcriptional repressor for pyruvate dehydrogenase complex